ncbi:MAG: hypothetical protein HY554_07765 [Elusimicrobia bacterium]|nr:hypothetical protein [Elusimicrobiota bacterium]
MNAALPVRLEAWASLFDELSDGVCVSDESFHVLYLNAAARRIMRLAERPRADATICALISMTLPTARLGRCAPDCPLQDPPARPSATRRLEGVRVRCLAAPEAMGSLHLTLLEDTRAEDELRRHQEDWRNMVAHDLRTPLTPILATLVLLLDNPALAAEERKIVEVSVGAGRRMLDLLSLYLDVAKLDAGLMPVRLERILLGPLLHEIVDEQSALARDKRQRLGLSIPEDLAVRGDAQLLPRVFDNLVNNAIKYTPAGGAIEMAAGRLGDCARVSVRDTGPGIAAQDLPRLFDRFFQAEARRNGRTTGTGLGLAFCKQALDSMGGRIHATSEPGRGSEFAVVLPEWRQP